MLAVGEIARSLYEEILFLTNSWTPTSVSSFIWIDSNPLGNCPYSQKTCSSCSRIYHQTACSQRQTKKKYTVEKTDLQIIAIQELFPTQIHTESDARKRLAITTSLGFGQNILREKTLNTKQILSESGQLKQNQDGKEFGELKQLPQLPELRLTRQLDNPPAAASVKNIRKYSVENEKDYSRRESRNPYCDQQIYMQNAHLNTIRDRKKHHPRKKRILSICIKGQNSPNMFIS